MSFCIEIMDYGFCGGVFRADELIKNIRYQEKEPLYVYGELIHNERYHYELEKQNIYILPSLEESQDKIVFIRTHGISPQEEKILYNKAKKVYDLTCPLVKSIQKKAQERAANEDFVLLLGDPSHPEVLGIVGYLKKYTILSSINDINESLLKNEKQISLLSQSTFSQDDYFEIVQKVKKIRPDIYEMNTLCNATTQRQNNAEFFAKDYDMVIVIGGKNSSNTKKIYEKAFKESLTKNVLSIQDQNDLKNYDFSLIKSVALTSGTSTPKYLIQEVIEVLKTKGGEFLSKL